MLIIRKVRLASALLIVFVVLAVGSTACALPGSSSTAAKKTSNDSQQSALKWADCMRQHGVQVSDPNTKSGITVGSGSGSDSGPNPEDPTFQAAATACQKYLEQALTDRPQNNSALQQRFLSYARCMRQHGIADFPDPSGSGGSISFGGSSAGGDLDPNSPDFQKASQACASILVGSGGGPGPASGSTGGN